MAQLYKTYRQGPHHIIRIFSYWYFLSLGLIFLSNSVSAANEAQDNSSSSIYTLQYENDSITSKNSDHDYTHGIQLTILKKEKPPTWITSVTELIPFFQKENALPLVQYTLGEKMFTPYDISIHDLQTNDRPYAGYLYFSTTVITHNGHSKNYDSGEQFEFTFGLVGPSAYGEELQTFGHKLTNSQISRGWDNQLKDELTFGLTYSNVSRTITPISDGFSFGINQQNSAALGNAYTFASTGVMFRVGNNLSQDLSPPNIHPSFSGITYFQSKEKSSWYIYLSLEARLIYRNIFLDGNTFTNSHKVEKKPIIGDVAYGFVYIFDNMRVAISTISRSKEYTTQKEDTNYGAISFSFQY